MWIVRDGIVKTIEQVSQEAATPNIDALIKNSDAVGQLKITGELLTSAIASYGVYPSFDLRVGWKHLTDTLKSRGASVMYAVGGFLDRSQNSSRIVSARDLLRRNGFIAPDDDPSIYDGNGRHVGRINNGTIGTISFADIDENTFYRMERDLRDIGLFSSRK